MALKVNQAIFITLLATFAAQPALAQEADKPKLMQPGAPGEGATSLTGPQSLELSKTIITKHDIMFMQDMIVHHTQAIDMSNLIKDRSDDASMALLGTRITMSQKAEIAMMKRWLDERNFSTHSMMAMQHEAMVDGKPSTKPVMMGMLSPAEMVTLAASKGEEFENLYLTGMIKHHTGALIMVDNLLKNKNAGEDTLLSEFLNAIVADQSGEIIRMEMMLAQKAAAK